jgi:hypothetical protein
LPDQLPVDEAEIWRGDLLTATKKASDPEF